MTNKTGNEIEYASGIVVDFQSILFKKDGILNNQRTPFNWLAYFSKNK